MKISDNIKKVLVVTATLIVTVLLVYFVGPRFVRGLIYLFGLLSPFVFSYALSKIINPAADKMQKKLKIPRGISAVIFIAITIVVIFGIVGFLGYKLVDEIINLARNWPQIFAGLRDSWNDLVDGWSRMYIEMPQFLKTAIDGAWASIYKEGVTIANELPVMDAAQVVARSLPKGIIWGVMFILSTYFMVTQKRSVTALTSKLFGEKAGNKLSEIKGQCKRYLGGYVKAQLILMVLMFVIIFIILSLADAPFALLVAVITAILDALPFFGSGLVLWPMGIIYLVEKNIVLGIVYIATYFVTMLTRRFVEPKLVSDKLGFSTLWTLVSMYVGYKLWGISGLIIGPLVLMLIISLNTVGLFKRPKLILKQLMGFVVKETKVFAEYLSEITK